MRFALWIWRKIPCLAYIWCPLGKGLIRLSCSWPEGQKSPHYNWVVNGFPILGNSEISNISPSTYQDKPREGILCKTIDSNLVWDGGRSTLAIRPSGILLPGHSGFAQKFHPGPGKCFLSKPIPCHEKFWLQRSNIFSQKSMLSKKCLPVSSPHPVNGNLA